MTRNALAHVGSYVVIIAGLLLPAVSYAANSSSPYDQDGANPAKSNCDSRTGCANYSTGDLMNKNPLQMMNSSPYDPCGANTDDACGANPAHSNCDSTAGCANYPTGGQTKTNPTQPQQPTKQK